MIGYSVYDILYWIRDILSYMWEELGYLMDIYRTTGGTHVVHREKLVDSYSFIGRKFFK